MVALLEPDAAEFSVPSKVLSYLSAGRPTIALVPAGNPCADDVRRAGGFVGEPTQQGAVLAAQWLHVVGADAGALATLGREARALAAERFDIERIATQFETILTEAATSEAVRVGAPLMVVGGVGESAVS
jgi:glycosyltransferase involved in cell wall biosynthesis